MSTATMRRSAVPGRRLLLGPDRRRDGASRSSSSSSSSSTSPSLTTTSPRDPPARPGRDLCAPGTRGLGLLEGREVSTVTALLTNKAYGYPTAGRASAPEADDPRLPAPDRQRQGNGHPGAQLREPGGLAGAVGHGLHRPRRHDRAGDRPGQVRGLEPGRRRASQHEDPDDRRGGRLGREHERVGARVDRVLGCRHRARTPTPSSRVSPSSSPRLEGDGPADQPQHRGRPRRHQQREPPQRPLAAGHTRGEGQAGDHPSERDRERRVVGAEREAGDRDGHRQGGRHAERDRRRAQADAQGAARLPARTPSTAPTPGSSTRATSSA